MHLADRRSDQAFDMATVMWRAFWAIFELNSVLLAAALKGAGVESRALSRWRVWGMPLIG